MNYEDRLLSSTNFMLVKLLSKLFDKGVLTLEEYKEILNISNEWMKK